jgi:hypothetical protein
MSRIDLVCCNPSAVAVRFCGEGVIEREYKRRLRRPFAAARRESYFTTVFVPQHALDTNLFIAGLAEEPVELVAPKTVQL